MSGHEMDRISEEQHQRLCAWIFGELEGDDARAFEAELAASSTLQAERERLAATIGLVQRSLPAESLSEAARASVVAAAQGRPAAVPRWTLLRGGGSWRVAAAIALVLGALVVVRASGRRSFEGSSEDHLVRREESPFQYRVGSDPLDARESKDEAAAEPSAAAAQEAIVSERRNATSLTVAQEPAGDGARPSVLDPESKVQPEGLGYAARLDEDTADALRALGYVDGGGGGSYRDPGDSVPPSSQAPAGVARRTASSAIARSHAQEQGLTDTPRRQSGGGSKAALPSVDIQGQESNLAVMPLEKETTFVPALPPGPGEISAPSQALPKAVSSSVDSGASELLDELRGLGYAAENDAARTDSEVDRLAPAREPVATWSEEELHDYCERLFRGCRILPRESPGAMFFRCWGDNPFEYAALDPLSTFSVDVDTASYTLARRYLQDGYLPTKAQVRTEEFVNFFDADVPAPERGETFALALELAPSLFGGDPEAWMLRVALRGEDVDRVERAPLALTFVLDVSGSMTGERIGLVKQAVALCVRELSTTDSIALVTFNTEARIVSPMVSAASRAAFENALVGLSTGGSTNAAAGLELGYELAAAALTPGAVNRVILLSDGVANTGETDQVRILARVAEYRAKGIYLNAVGVGMGNHDDVFLEQLADQGDGLCHYVDRLDEARRVFVEEFAQTLQPIARDVKVQVEFDPAQVERYRLIGYENRAVADADFRNDAIDAGEVNAGHQVVALYEIVRRGADAEAPLATARLRWKPPFVLDRGSAAAAEQVAAERAFEKAVELRAPQALASWENASRGYRRDVLVAQFAELLRRSVHARGDSWNELLGRLQRLLVERPDAELSELHGLMARAREMLALREHSEDDDLRRRLDELCRLHYDESCRRALEGSSGAREDDELSREADEMRRRIEERIRELLRERRVAPK